MKHWWIVLFGLLYASASWAQNAPEAPQPAPQAQAFELRVQAPEAMRTLLERHLELQRYREITDLSDDEIMRLMEAARINAQELLATQGYFSPAITISQSTHSSGMRTIEVQVQTGEPVRIKAVQLQFAGPIAIDPSAAEQRRAIQETWGLPVGQRFTQSAWDDAKQKALRLLTSQRYPVGQITRSLADIDPASHSATLMLTLQSGDLYKWGSLAIDGLERYDDVLVRRLARLPTGTPYDLNTLVGAQRRLTDSGFFDSAYITLDTNSSPDAAIAQLKLREAKLQKLVLGVGVSTDAGTRLSAEHIHMQLPWLGWQSSSKVALDRLIKSLNVNLQAQPDEDGWRWNTGAQLKNDDSGSYQVISQRLRAGSSQKTERFDRAYYLQYDRADTAPTDFSTPTTAQAISANYAIALRRFDSLPYPSEGWGLGVELGGGTTLGAQRHPFTRVLGHWHGLLTFDGDDDSQRARALASRLALRAQVGAVLAKEEAQLPVTELFLAGGSTSVRGYPLNGIGIELSNGTVSPGKYLTTGTVEWQRPIRIDGQVSDWESAVFIDMGAVANTPQKVQVKTGVGAGVRWRTPIGPLQIDLAYGLALKRLRLHLNIGFTF